MSTKTCTKCASVVPRNNRSGLCRPCYLLAYWAKTENRQRRSENGKRWARENPDRHRQKSIEWQRKNPERTRAIAAKTMSGATNRYTRAVFHAKRRGLAWTLSKEDFLALRERCCTYCSAQLDRLGSGLDRIDNLRGYERGNVVPCCGSCNRTRGDRLTYEEMKAAMAAVVSLRQSKRVGIVSR